MRFGPVDPVALLDALGREHYRAGSELRAHCPHPDHPRRAGPGSVQFLAAGERAGEWVCFGCPAHGGPVAFVRLALGVGGVDARAWIVERFGPGIPAGAELVRPVKFQGPSDELPMPGRSHPLWGREDRSWTILRSQARSYAEGRGFDGGDLEHYRIRAACERDAPYFGRVIVPVVVQGHVVDLVARLFVPAPPHVPKALSGQKSRGARREFALWGYDDLDPGWPVVHVCEGIWGAKAAIDAGLENVVACCGSEWSEARTALLRPWPTRVLIPDGDPAGARLERRAAALRREGELLVVDLPAKAQPDGIVREEGQRSFLRRVRAARASRGVDLVPRVKIAPWAGKQ